MNTSDLGASFASPETSESSETVYVLIRHSDHGTDISELDSGIQRSPCCIQQKRVWMSRRVRSEATCRVPVFSTEGITNETSMQTQTQTCSMIRSLNSVFELGAAPPYAFLTRRLGLIQPPTSEVRRSHAPVTVKSASKPGPRSCGP